MRLEAQAKAGFYPTPPKVVEIITDRAKTAKNLLGKVVAGNLFSVRARPGAFSILYLNPPYDFDAEDGRTELSFLKHTLPYLAPKGLLLFLVPQKRITTRIARVLSAYFEDLKVRKFLADELHAFGQIVIAGVKKARAAINGDVLAGLTQIHSMDLPEM